MERGTGVAGAYILVVDLQQQGVLARDIVTTPILAPSSPRKAVGREPTARSPTCQGSQPQPSSSRVSWVPPAHHERPAGYRTIQRPAIPLTPAYFSISERHICQSKSQMPTHLEVRGTVPNPSFGKVGANAGRHGPRRRFKTPSTMLEMSSPDQRRRQRGVMRGFAGTRWEQPKLNGPGVRRNVGRRVAAELALWRMGVGEFRLDHGNLMTVFLFLGCDVGSWVVAS